MCDEQWVRPFVPFLPRRLLCAALADWGIATVQQRLAVFFVASPTSAMCAQGCSMRFGRSEVHDSCSGLLMKVCRDGCTIDDSQRR